MFSKNSKGKTVKELVVMLKYIIKAMKNKVINELELKLPTRKSLPILGSLTVDVTELDLK